MKLSEKKHDLSLAYYDCISGIAYAFMLKNRCVISDEEFALLKQGYQELILLSKHDEITLSFKDKDPFSPIDTYLSEKLNGLADELNIKRSKNDRLILDLQLLMREAVLGIIEEASYLSVISKDTIHTLKHLYTLIEYNPVQTHEDDLIMAKMLGFKNNTRETCNTIVKDKLALIHILQKITNEVETATKSKDQTSSTIISKCLTDVMEINKQQSINISNLQSLASSVLLAIETTRKALQGNKNEDAQWVQQKRQAWSECLERLL